MTIKKWYNVATVTVMSLTMPSVSSLRQQALSSQEFLQIIGCWFTRTDTRNKAALFLDIICNFQWIKGNGSIEICKEYTENNIYDQPQLYFS